MEKLTGLDKKGGGREIAGLDPKREKFSALDPNKDIVGLKKNKDIVCDVYLDDLYVFVNPSQGTKELLVEAPHWRTISEENIHASIETDHGKEFFYTANIKGVGYLKPTLKDKNLDDYKDWIRIDEYDYEGAYGMSGKDDFYSEDGDLVLKSKWLNEQGLRTELYYSFGKLKNAYYQGELVSVESLRAMGIIPNRKTFIPHIGIRLLKLNTRIAEVKESEPSRATELFKKAFEIFNQESQDRKLDLPKIVFGDPESEKIYFTEFFKRMGTNLAVFQNLGYIGWHLHSANTTLAAEIVDIGPYQPWSIDKNDDEFVKLHQGVRRGVWKDFRDTAYGLRYLIQAGKAVGMQVPDREVLIQDFMDAFLGALKDEYLHDEQVAKADLISACSRVLNAVIVERKNLPSLKHGGDVSEWGID